MTLIKQRPLIKYSIVLFVLIGLTNCVGLYGIKTPQPVDQKTILLYSDKYNIPRSDSYELDSTYISFISSFDSTSHKAQKKNHLQPLQALYYDKKGKLQSFQVNCYAGGFPNLKWNRNGIMTSFPPQQQAPLDQIIPLEKHLTFLRPLSPSGKLPTESYDYVVILYWNKFMGRQSERLVQYIQDNSKLATDKKVKIIYANTDNIFARF